MQKIKAIMPQTTKKTTKKIREEQSYDFLSFQI